MDHPIGPFISGPDLVCFGRKLSSGSSGTKLYTCNFGSQLILFSVQHDNIQGQPFGLLGHIFLIGPA